MNWLQHLSNPKALTLKKYFLNLLKEKYVPFDDLVERLAYALQTEGDLDKFHGLIKEVYMTGFNQAVENYKDEMAKLGLRVEVSNPD